MENKETLCFEAKELKLRIEGIIYNELAFLYQKDMKSIPCKDRETIKNNITNRLMSLFTKKQD